jgi:hypothetical protein
MSKGTVNSSASGVSGQVDLVTEPAPEPLTFFGINLMRVLKVPLQHLSLSAVILVVCGLIGFVYARQFARASYESMGTLIYRAPPELKDVPAPKNLETHVEEMRNLHYYKQLNDKFGLSIPPEIFSNLFTILKPTDSSVIQVKLRWDNSEEAPQLINYLMDLHRKEAEAYRRKDLEIALKVTSDALQEIDRKLNLAIKDRDKFLRAKKISGNIKEKVAEVNREATRLDTLIETARFEQRKLTTDLKKCIEDIDELKKRQKEGMVDPDDEGSEDDYRQRKGQIEIELIGLKQELAEKERLLRGKEEEYKVKKPLADKGAIIQPVIVELERTIKDTSEAVEAARKKIAIRTREMNDLRPGSARLRRLLAQRSSLQLKDTATRDDLTRLEQQREAIRERARDLEDVENDWGPLNREVETRQKERDGLRIKQGELDLRLRNVGSELEISSAAEPSLIPSVDFKKKLAMGFLVPALLCFGALVVRDMTLPAWRAETIAERLRLPVLARASRKHRPHGGAELSSDEFRALSLRLRQFLPQEGAVFLVSSLNDGPGFNPLVSGVSRYLGMRNERVLILDARIAQAEAQGLASAIEQRADGKAIEVVGGEAAGAAVGPVGLVQALVFDDQNWSEFTYHLRMAGVDYIPSGGPYAITDVLATETMDQLLQNARKKYTMILLLGPNLGRGVDTEILAAYADGMMVVIDEPLGTYTREIQDLVQTLKDAKPDLLLGSVVCV